MLIAINNNKERVSIKDTLINEKYYCPLCGEELVMKKGMIRRHHFAHKANGVCSESKYSDMCEWHINWQERFPKENLEIIKIDEMGKKHVADVLINDTEIEIQNSFMPFNEFNDRNEFYNKFNYRVIWIFNGNDIFDKGFNMGPFPFSKKFDCLKHLKDIPEYLDIFIEGEVKYNLLTEHGLFLHHVGRIDEKEGIIFDGKCTIDEFMNNVKNDIEFKFGVQKNVKYIEIPTIESNNYTNTKTILEIAKKYPYADYLILYNVYTKYDVLIDKNNLNRLKQGKKIYGKLKNHYNYGRFDNPSTEIYYAKDSVWIYQNHY